MSRGQKRKKYRKPSRKPNLIEKIVRWVNALMDRRYDFYNKWFPTELREIAEIIASGKPVINKDDICDQLLELWQAEKDFKKPDADGKQNTKHRKLAVRYAK